MRLILAKKLGFCSGVMRAISLAQSIPKKNVRKGTISTPVYTLGSLIHNPQEVGRLGKLGVKAISGLNQIKKGTLIIPSHGLPRPILRKIDKMQIRVIDATCPFVKRAQLLAKRLHERGYHLVIVGQKSHPEVISLLSFAKGSASVVSAPQGVERIKTDERIGVISQTTQSVEDFEKIAGKIKKKTKSCTIYDTICKETSRRQREARELAKKSDLVIVIGGKNSANTTRLYDICSKFTCAYHVESAKQLRPEWLDRREVVGVTAGTSTPDWVIRDVVKSLRKGKPG